MWISVCKNSGYLVKNQLFIHNQFTIDELQNLNIVDNWIFIQTLSKLFHDFIHSALGFYESLISRFAHYPHKLLLLLLSIKLNIINKTNLNWSSKL